MRAAARWPLRAIGSGARRNGHELAHAIGAGRAEHALGAGGRGRTARLVLGESGYAVPHAAVRHGARPTREAPRAWRRGGRGATWFSGAHQRFELRAELGIAVALQPLLDVALLSLERETRFPGAKGRSTLARGQVAVRHAAQRTRALALAGAHHAEQRHLNALPIGASEPVVTRRSRAAGLTKSRCRGARPATGCTSGTDTAPPGALRVREARLSVRASPGLRIADRRVVIGALGPEGVVRASVE